MTAGSRSSEGAAAGSVVLGGYPPLDFEVGATGSVVQRSGIGKFSISVQRR